jgi:hypothetical protein
MITLASSSGHSETLNAPAGGPAGNNTHDSAGSLTAKHTSQKLITPMINGLSEPFATRWQLPLFTQHPLIKS